MCPACMATTAMLIACSSFHGRSGGGGGEQVSRLSGEKSGDGEFRGEYNQKEEIWEKQRTSK